MPYNRTYSDEGYDAYMSGIKDAKNAPAAPVPMSEFERASLRLRALELVITAAIAAGVDAPDGTQFQVFAEQFLAFALKPDEAPK